jgi:cytochrome b
MRSLHGTRFGGTEGNEILTSATAWVLVGLLAAEGFTIVNMHGLVGAHMFIGMVLIPPVVLKLASTGYRFARYYTGARAYRRKGPPLLPLRLMAPVLVASTVAVFVTGVLLLAAGHKSGTLLELHKLSFIVWAVVFAVHFLAYLPRIVRSLREDWAAARRRAVPGTGVRALLVVAAVGSGTALALSLLPAITAWHGGR